MARKFVGQPTALQQRAPRFESTTMIHTWRYASRRSIRGLRQRGSFRRQMFRFHATAGRYLRVTCLASSGVPPPILTGCLGLISSILARSSRPPRHTPCALGVLFPRSSCQLLVYEDVQGAPPLQQRRASSNVHYRQVRTSRLEAQSRPQHSVPTPQTAVPDGTAPLGRTCLRLREPGVEETKCDEPLTLFPGETVRGLVA